MFNHVTALLLLAVIVAGIGFSLIELVLRHDHVAKEATKITDAAAKVDEAVQPVIAAVKAVADPDGKPAPNEAPPST